MVLGLCSTSSFRWEKKHSAYFTCASGYSFFHVHMHVATPSVCMSLEGSPSIFQPGPHCPQVLLGSRRNWMSHRSVYLLQLARAEGVSPSLTAFGWLFSSFPSLHYDRAGCYSRNATFTQCAGSTLPLRLGLLLLGSAGCS